MNRSAGPVLKMIAILALSATACIDREARNDATATIHSELLLGDAVEVSAGRLHTCARQRTGSVMCWGSGDYGQLGDGKSSSSPTPVTVAGLSDAVSISAGGFHSCAIRSDRTVVCWGRGEEGQLGTGNASGSATPVAVTGLVDATAISAGGAHTCALRANGTVVCWGWNDNGQLGTGDFTTSLVPVPVGGIAGAASIAAGTWHSCARLAAGNVWCWGSDDYDQLGMPIENFTDPVPFSSPVPIAAFGLTDAIGRVTAGSYQSCAVRSGGQVSCWGGIFADSVGGSSSPAVVPGISDALSVTVGEGTACAVRATGAVVCWHAAAGEGAANPTPVAVPGLADATGVSAGYDHVCAVRAGGGVVCWGRGFEGELGDGRSFWTGRPTLGVAGVADGAAIASGDEHSCVVRSTGQVACWGAGGQGEVAPGNTDQSYAPITVSGIGNASSVAAGSAHTCALRTTGGIACWGSNSMGQLGIGNWAVANALVTVSGISDARSIAAGAEHTCAVRATGSVTCWGSGELGELGDGRSTSSNLPVTVSGLSDATAVAVGRLQICARRGTGSVVCWGVGDSGQLGTGSLASSAVPVAVTNLSDATAVAAGDQSMCALRSTGAVVCWGAGSSGQLGNGASAPSAVPVGVSGLTDAVAIIAGQRHACAVRASGAVVCWGAGESGQLGNGGTAGSAVPVSVVGLSDAVALSAGAQNTCALRRTGAVVCWGPGTAGQLGNGILPTAATPVDVALADDDRGKPCRDGTECSRGFCVDSVCCDVACGGTADCRACSRDAGASADGTCTLRAAGSACTDDRNACTIDACDGGGTCQHTAGNAGKVCSDVNACDSTEVCSGSSAACPAATKLPAANCSAVTSGSTTIGFLGWTDNIDVTNNPFGSVLLIFTGLTSPGTATVVQSNVGPGLPAGFQTVGADNAQYWHIETSATYTSLTVCIRYDKKWLGSSPDTMLQLWHYNKDTNVFKDETNSGFPDTNSQLICADVTSLSPFALVLPIDTTPPILPPPPDVTTYATSRAGAVVNFTVPTATDSMDTAPQVGCTPASGSTFAPGKTTVTCTASDAAGNTATASFTIWVRFQSPTDGSFFLQPINPDGSSLFKRGSTIPVKFKLQGASAAITSLAAHLSIAKVSNGVSGTYAEADSTATCDEGNSFRYDAAGRQYIFNLSTRAMSIGTWSLRADLGDGVEHTVNVSLR